MLRAEIIANLVLCDLNGVRDKVLTRVAEFIELKKKNESKRSINLELRKIYDERVKAKLAKKAAKGRAVARQGPGEGANVTADDGGDDIEEISQELRTKAKEDKIQ